MRPDVVPKRFETPDEVREFELGKFELVTLGGMTIGRATYQPGWKWSVHVGAALGATSCHVEHVGMVVSGCAAAAMDDGKVIEMRAGDIFYIPPRPRQLGRRRRALCFAPLHGCRGLRGTRLKACPACLERLPHL